MEIRYATKKDYKKISRSLYNKKISYNTPLHAKNDILSNNLIIAIDNGKILGSVALQDKPEFDYMGVCRVCIYNKKNNGKGIASALLKYVCSLGIENLGATPWNTNPTMCHLFEKFGFEYQYTFMEHYCFYKKTIDK